MAYTGIQCGSCAFQNPRGWVACARCGHLLGPPREPGEETATHPHLSYAATRADDAETGPLPGLHETQHDAQPLLGQSGALESIRAAQRRCFSSERGNILLLHGPRGSGRTRLLVAASEIAAHGWPDVQVYYAASRTHEDGPYAPFSRLLLQRFGVAPASSLKQVQESIAFEVLAALRPSHAHQHVEYAHLLGHIAGIPFHGSPFLSRGQKSGPDSILPRAAEALSAFLSHDAGARPTLLLLDDMGAEDAEALALLTALARVTAPLLCIITGPQAIGSILQDADLPNGFQAHSIAPLDSKCVEELARTIVPDLQPPPAGFYGALQHRTQGNPASVRELLRALKDGGALEPVHGGLRVNLDRLAHGDLPLTMDDAIRARLTTLDRKELQVLELASVIGERFWEAALLALHRSEHLIDLPQHLDPLELFEHATDESEILETLERLQSKGFLVRISESPTVGLCEYTFHFAETRKVIYGDLSEQVRAGRHSVVARWLSATPVLEGVPALIAPHFARAGMAPRAARAYLRAAKDERVKKRTTMALRFTDKALALLTEEDVARRIEALHVRGSLLTTLGRYDDAIGAFEDMLRAAFQVAARGPAGAAVSRIARVYRQRGELTAAQEYLKSALALFRSAADEPGVASTFDDLAQLHRFSGEPVQALAAANAALDIRTRRNDKRGQAVTLNTIGNIELDRGQFAEAQARLEVAAVLRSELGDHEGYAQTQLGLGRLALQQGTFASGIATLTHALDSAREMDHHRLQSYLLFLLGEAYLGTHQAALATEALDESRALAIAMRDQRALCEIERIAGLVALHDQSSCARRRLLHSLELAEAYGAKQVLGLAHRALACLYGQTVYDAEGAATSMSETHFRTALNNFERCGAAHEVARTHAQLGLSLFEQGKHGAAKVHLLQASPTLEALGMLERVEVGRALKAMVAT